VKFIRSNEGEKTASENEDDPRYQTLLLLSTLISRSQTFKQKFSTSAFSALPACVRALFSEARRSRPDRVILDKLVEVIATGLIPEPDEHQVEGAKEKKTPAPISTPNALEYKELVTKCINDEDRWATSEALWSL
jgi:hypothetical protein